MNFDKISGLLSFRTQYDIKDGIAEVYNALKHGVVWDYPDTVTVKWYKYLLEANTFLREVTVNGEVL